MPSLSTRLPKFSPKKPREIDYQDFSGGWNNIFRPTELKPNELAQADNLMLTGKGVPKGRWGSQDYFLAGSGKVRLLADYRDPANSINQLLSLTDMGFLVKKSGASYSIITGASFSSGYSAEAAQLGGKSYIVGGNRELTRFDGTSLLPYVSLPAPAGVTATNFSGATGSTTWSWRITALNLTGETVGSTAISLASLPYDLSQTLVKLNWGVVSGASGGYSIYRGTPGNETYVSSVGALETAFNDGGAPQSDVIFPPNSNTTGGPKAKFILKFDDRLVIAGINGDPTLVLVSGRYPYNDRFHWADGGGYIRINPDGGDEITGLGISGSQSQGGQTPASILVFMKNSVHQLVLKSVTIGNFSILDPQSQVLAPNGCSSGKTVVPVENNTFYFGRLGLFTIGSEAAFLNQIRTKEISARIRNYVQNLSEDDFNNACAGYLDYKYLLSFPNKDTIVYDFERAAFMGPWKTPWGVSSWFEYFDENGVNRKLAGAESGYVKEFSEALTSDSGTAIKKLLRTRKEDFGDWSVMKILKTVYVLFRNIKGSVSVNIRLEERGGNTVTTKSFNVTGALGTAGWGTDKWGNQQWGKTQGTVTLTGEEIIRWSQIYKNARVLQLEVVSTASNANWEFLGFRATAQPQSEGSLSSATRV